MPPDSATTTKPATNARPLGLFRRHHDSAGEACTLDSLGYIAHRTGHHEEAIRQYQQALALFRDLSDTSQVADTLDKLGHSHAALGQREQVHAVWCEALELHRAQQRHDDADRVRRQLDDLGDIAVG